MRRRNKISVIFSEDELSIIEGLLGRDYTFLYDKIWQEREAVKRYEVQVRKNIESTKGYSRIYWEYKLSELQTVLENQGLWLYKVLGELKNQIPEEMYQRLEKYIEDKGA